MVKIVAVGDFDCTDNTNQIFKNIKSQNPDLVLGLGDFSYDSKLDCFTSLIEKIDPNLKNIFKVVIGNHDDEEKLKEKAKDFIDNIRENFGLGEKRYYSFNLKNVLFLMLYSTNRSKLYDRNSQQYKDIEKILSDAKSNPTIAWKIACYHKTTLTSDDDHDPEYDFGKIYHPLFEEHGVDLILTGHNHNYQRSKVVKTGSGQVKRPEVTQQVENRSGPFDTRKGIIHIVSGTGGHELRGFDNDKPEYYIETRIEDYGFFMLEITDGNTMKCTFMPNNGEHRNRDEFTIRKSPM